MAICEMKVTSVPLCFFWEHAISSPQVFLRALGRHPFSISSFAVTRELYSGWKMMLGHVANFSSIFAIHSLFHFYFVCAAAFHSVKTQGGNI